MNRDEKHLKRLFYQAFHLDMAITRQLGRAFEAGDDNRRSRILTVLSRNAKRCDRRFAAWQKAIRK